MLVLSYDQLSNAQVLEISDCPEHTNDVRDRSFKQKIPLLVEQFDQQTTLKVGQKRSVSFG